MKISTNTLNAKKNSHLEKSVMVVPLRKRGKHVSLRAIYFKGVVIPLNQFTSSGLFYHNSLDRSISNWRVPG